MQGSQIRVLPIYLSTLNIFLILQFFPVARPLYMSKLFGSVYKVYFHDKYRQTDLALEKYWVTQCGWLRLFTEVYMVMTI